ncbi:MAG: M23 family metallopeptidase, partial [Solirubrobacteraceae bacterium]|nr:M23 family metallopeptidase [Solirubrobacteraceae bacterium]
PSREATDYTCSSRSYDGHDGTDIRLPSIVAEASPLGVVRAAADGKVLRVRNDAVDVSVRETGIAKVAGVECGNGLVIAHRDGYETQYCHLAKGSVQPRPGDTVKAGQGIGQAGLSGASEFPHLHFTVRRDGATVDPFSLSSQSCSIEPVRLADSLWDPALHEGLTYKAGTILNSGFSDGPVTMAAIDAATVANASGDPNALVAWVRAIGLDEGDTQSFVLKGPEGTVLAEKTEPALARPRAQAMLFIGRKRPSIGWTPGTYSANYLVTRGGKVAVNHSLTIHLPKSTR